MTATEPATAPAQPAAAAVTPSATPATPPAAVSPVAAPEAKPSDAPEKVAYEFYAADGLAISEANKDKLLAHFESKIAAASPAEKRKLAEDAYALALGQATSLAEFAAEKGLSKEHATAFLDYGRTILKQQQDFYDARLESAKAESEKASKSDPKIGGERFEQSQQRAKQMAEKYSLKEEGVLSLWDEAERLGLHTSRAFLHFMNNIYDGQASPTSVVNGNATATKDPLQQMFNHPTSAPMFAGRS